MMGNTLKYIKLAITIGWPLLAGAATLLGSYKAFVYENVNQRSLIQANHNQIQKIDNHVLSMSLSHKNINKNLSDDNLTITILKDKVNNIGVNLMKTTEYQQVLRKEVQALAEGKLNISEFWHYVDLINLERENKYVGTINPKS